MVGMRLDFALMNKFLDSFNSLVLDLQPSSGSCLDCFVRMMFAAVS